MDRTNQELANAIVATADSGGVTAGVTLQESTTAAVFFRRVTASDVTGLAAESIFESGKWGDHGEHYVDGYTYLYWGPPSGTAPTDTGKLEQNVIAKRIGSSFNLKLAA